MSLVPPLFAANATEPSQSNRGFSGKVGPSVYDLTRGDQNEIPWVVELQQGMRAMLGSQESAPGPAWV